jgi:hypothetical protein
MSYLCYLCIVVPNTYCVVFVLFLYLSLPCVPNVASFSVLSILDCPFGFLGL